MVDGAARNVVWSVFAASIGSGLKSIQALAAVTGGTMFAGLLGEIFGFVNLDRNILIFPAVLMHSGLLTQVLQEDLLVR